MEKFGMNFGSGPSKKELLETVEEQKQQLLQYQARLKDVVRAYKSLLKEKEALEASLKVLSATHEAEAGLAGGGAPPVGLSASSPAPSEDRSSVHSSEDSSAGTVASLASIRGDLAGSGPEEEPPPPGAPAAPAKPEEASGSESGVSCSSGEAPAAGTEEVDRRVLQLKSQLATLTSALATVTQEKSRMEASYQADKRKVKQEVEEAGRRAEEDRSRLAAEALEAQAQLAEIKARLIAQQHDRAQEQSDHALMLRELQRLLQSERALREEAEQGLEETREALAGKASVADHRAEGSALQARQLLQEVEGLRKEMERVRAESSSRPDPQLQALRAEAESLRSLFQAQLLQEARKTSQAEERVQMEEQRVSSLEAQISEMSELLGTYEKAKQKDQLALQKLRDRVAQLDLENKTLAMAASGRSASADTAIEESNLDVNVLKDKLEKLRRLLRAATKPARGAEEEEEEEEEAAMEEKGDFGGNEAADGEKATAAYYRQELKQLKEEFERYKLRAQVVLKNKSAKDGSLARELEEAQEQLAELREKYVSLRLSCEELAKQHQEELEAKKQDALRLQQLHRQVLERCELDYREKAFRLEEEVHKQRARALAVLAEKDQELLQLRALALPGGPQGSKALPDTPNSSVGAEGAAEEGSLESLAQALSLTTPTEPTFLLYTEQLARKHVELSALKKQKLRLEAEIRRLQEQLLAEGEKHREEVSALQSRIQKAGRDQRREGANLEYLKNILFRFLTLTDSLGRQQTLAAILTILHFSPEEKQAVLGHSAGGGHSWWHSGRR